MILSKQNLEIVAAAAVDKGIPILGNVHIEKDGSTVATNGRVFVIVSPVTDEVKEKVQLPVGDLERSESMTLPVSFVKEIMKNLPKDTMFGGILEHADFKSLDRKEVIVTLNDGKRRRQLQGKKYERGYIDYKKIMQETINRPRASIKAVVNRKRLMNLLSVIDKVCPDSTGETPVWMEFTDAGDIIVRSVNRKTGQRIVGIARAYQQDEERWLHADEWEQNLCKEKPVARIARFKSEK